jgi:hypothetical protein
MQRSISIPRREHLQADNKMRQRVESATLLNLCQRTRGILFALNHFIATLMS